jgi:hypothetical protein
MNQKPTTDKQPSDTSRGRQVLARLGLIATSLTVVAFGPGLALAEARIFNNHNEVLVTTDR